MFKKINLVIILTVGIMIFNSCNTEPGSEELHKELIFFHDEAMAHTSTIYRAQKAVKKKLAEADSTTSDSILNKLNSQLDVFKSAESNMRTWMNEFRVNYSDELTEEEKVRVLKNELIKVKSLNDEINEAVKLAKEL